MSSILTSWNHTMSKSKVRTEITVDAPERWESWPAPGGLRRAECWVVEVREVPLPVGHQYEVQGRLLWADTPEGRRPIPGLVVPAKGPRAFRTLAAARKDARRLADVLSGQLYPQWTERAPRG